MSLNNAKVIKLIGLMNENSGFHIPPMPAVIRCFNEAMDADTLEFLLRVGTPRHSKKTLEELFYTMKATGEISDKYTWDSMWNEVITMCFLLPSQDGTEYELAPIFPGWLEMSTAGEPSEKNTRIMNQWMDFWEFIRTVNVAPVRAFYNSKNTKIRDANEVKMSALTSITPAGKPSKKRVIEVNEELESQQEVLTLGTVFEILERNKDHLAVMNCICRNHKEMETGKPCGQDFPLQSCMPVGTIADQIVEYGIGRAISYDEAVELMKDLERKGCIHTTFHYNNDASKDEMAICNCCIDCCMVYEGFRTGHLSQILLKAHNKPEIINEKACTGCNKCGQVCPTFAISCDKETKKLSFNYENCIGCGQCVTQCRFGVQKMVPDERPVFVKTLKKSKAHA